MRALSLLSGGLDSVVATWAARREHTLVAALTADYGQRAREPEVAAASRVAVLAPCQHIVVPLPWLGGLGQSAITDPDQMVPQVPADALDDDAAHQTARAVWVPNRNGVLVNVAAAYAEALDCDLIVCGFNAEEAATFPDNSSAFMEAADGLLALSTLRKPRLLSPTANLTKTQIVRLGLEISAPLTCIWSCYQPGPQHCWHCESCQRLKRALTAAGAWDDWLAQRATAGPP